MLKNLGEDRISSRLRALLLGFTNVQFHFDMSLFPYLGATNKLLKTGHIVPVTLLALIHIF